MSPTWNPKRPQVPVDKDGNWHHYPWHNDTWVEIQPFMARLKFDGMQTGRSAKYFILEDVATGIKYPMFISDFLDYIKEGDVVKGVMEWTWTASKRGSNYGIKRFKN